jgi:hypothetical protein
MPCAKLVDNNHTTTLSMQCAFLCWFYTKMCWNLIWLIINSIPTHKSNHLLMHAHLSIPISYHNMCTMYFKMTLRLALHSPLGRIEEFGMT